MKWIQVPATWRGPSRMQEVPCGRCAFCLVNKRDQWFFRMFYEMRNQQYPGYFLTLTYDEKHVRRVNGELSLRFVDVQLYLKRLRKNGFYAKYVCVGEYGTRTERPHYHLIIWTDAPKEFLQYNWRSIRTGKELGLVHFGNITVQSIMYTMKYIIQPKVLYKGREKPRAQFSKGLGISYLTKAQYNYLTQGDEGAIMESKIEGRTVALPRYYKNKIFTSYQLKLEAEKYVKEREREKKKERQRLIDQGISDPEAYLFKLREDRAKLIFKKTKVNELL